MTCRLLLVVLPVLLAACAQDDPTIERPRQESGAVGMLGELAVA